MPERNWSEYIKKLVNEVADVFVDNALLVDQEKQLREMNRGKEGMPYRYSNTLIMILLAVKECFGLPYRQTEGFAKMLGGVGMPRYHHTARYAGGRRSLEYQSTLNIRGRARLTQR